MHGDSPISVHCKLGASTGDRSDSAGLGLSSERSWGTVRAGLHQGPESGGHPGEPRGTVHVLFSSHLGRTGAAAHTLSCRLARAETQTPGMFAASSKGSLAALRPDGGPAAPVRAHPLLCWTRVLNEGRVQEAGSVSWEGAISSMTGGRAQRGTLEKALADAALSRALSVPPHLVPNAAAPHPARVWLLLTEAAPQNGYQDFSTTR